MTPLVRFFDKQEWIEQGGKRVKVICSWYTAYDNVFVWWLFTASGWSPRRPSPASKRYRPQALVYWITIPVHIRWALSVRHSSPPHIEYVLVVVWLMPGRTMMVAGSQRPNKICVWMPAQACFCLILIGVVARCGCWLWLWLISKSQVKIRYKHTHTQEGWRKCIDLCVKNRLFSGRQRRTAERQATEVVNCDKEKLCSIKIAAFVERCAEDNTFAGCVRYNYHRGLGDYFRLV